MGWGVAIPFFALLFVINKKFKGRQKNPKAQDGVAIATLVIAFIVGGGLAFTALGRLVAGMFSGAAGWLPVPSGPVIFGFLIILGGLAAADVMYDRVADKGAQVCMVLIPIVLVLMVGGTLGATGGDAVTAVTQKLAEFTSGLGGA